jgi:hypothetical protein
MCADKKRLAVVAADDPSGPVYLLEVTPAALKGLNQYQKELTMRGIPPEVVKTKVSFDSDASFPKLKFGFGGFLEANEQAIVDQLFGTDEVLEITGEKVQPRTPAPAPKAAPVKMAAPAPKAVVKPAPVPEPEPEPAVEPEKPAAAKRGFGATRTATKPAPAAAAPSAEMSLADEIAALVGEVGADDA